MRIFAPNVTVNHYISLYEHKFHEKPVEIKDLYLNEKNFINCPECVGNSN
jgi:hypothetical protein